MVYRGGSTYNWSVSGIGATIEQGALPNIVYITFDQSNVDVTATVSVTETTQGGKTSEAVTKTVNLLKFKAMDWSAFVTGTWSGTITDQSDNVENVTISFVENEAPVDGVGSIIFAATDGIPEYWDFVFENWGEVFQAGYGLEGDVIVDFNLNTGSVGSGCVYWGQTLPGPWDYWVSSNGSWDGITETIDFTLGFQFDDTCTDDWRTLHFELTKD